MAVSDAFWTMLMGRSIDSATLRTDEFAPTARPLAAPSRRARLPESLRPAKEQRGPRRARSPLRSPHPDFATGSRADT